jgi:hypothetical protein
MRPTNPVTFLMRALLLALVGVVVAAGTASAHEAHRDGRAAGLSSAQPATQAHQTHGAVEQRTPSEEAAWLDRDAAPCSGDQSSDHSSNGCCNIACHAALAATAAASIGTVQLGGLRIAGLTDLLTGRVSGPTERPPKLS